MLIRIQVSRCVNKCNEICESNVEKFSVIFNNKNQPPIFSNKIKHIMSKHETNHFTPNLIVVIILIKQK